MHEQFKRRALQLDRRMADEAIDVLVLTDPGSIYYIASFWDYLGMEFGRPTMLVVRCSGDCVLITPALEAEMAAAMTWVDDIRTWKDGNHWEWVEHVRDLVGGRRSLKVGIERFQIHPRILECLTSEAPAATLVDASPILTEMRMIKDLEEIAAMRQAGQVAVAMAEAGFGAIGEGVPEYEISLAATAAGVRKAAEFLSNEGPERLMSPLLSFAQVLHSGPDISMTHRRATVRRLRKGDAVAMCFCGLTNFKHLKLGLDRGCIVTTAADEQFKWYEIALQSQAAALQWMRPGNTAGDVYAAAKDVLAAHGMDIGNNRVGRGIGYSFAEIPELTKGNKTVLRPGMTFALSGSVKIPGKANHHIGDSVVVTDSGFEFLTDYPRHLRVL